MGKNTEMKLSAEVAEKYTLEGITPTVHVLPMKYGGQKVDFRNMSLKQAEELIRRNQKHPEGFPYLKPKKASGSGSGSGSSAK